MPRSKPEDTIARKARAVELAIEGKSWGEIAKIIGVSQKTLWKWRKEVLFQKEIARLQEAIFKETASKHASYLNAGMLTLKEIARSKAATPEDRIKAAEALVALIHRNIEVIKVIEHNEIVLKNFGKKGEDVQLESSE